jgi:hypothetical protein
MWRMIHAARKDVDYLAGSPLAAEVRERSPVQGER